MANPEHEAILRQGADVWNQWREKSPNLEPDLSYANLEETELADSNLCKTDLSNTNLTLTNLSGADLSGADLSFASLIETEFIDTNLRNAVCNSTIFVNLDLSESIGLDRVSHIGPSTLGVDTIFRSKGKIPERFLRGCGVPEILIKFLPSMMEDAIQFYSCFISYSHEDKEFAQLLHDRLQGVGIRCWLDEHQLKPGDELHKTIYEGIRVYDKVILCCSETALKSWWVEKEFKNAYSKEEDFIEKVLIPISLDEYLFKQSKDDPTIGLIRQRYVQDFSNWKNHDAFEVAFKNVVDALRTDGGKPPPPESKLIRR